jgi:perosamine synthetase
LDCGGQGCRIISVYVIRLLPPLQRAVIFQALRQMEIGVNVHYIPVHLNPYFRERFGTGPGLCPAAEAAYEEIVSIPIFPAMSDEQVQQVVAALEETLRPGPDG